MIKSLWFSFVFCTGFFFYYFQLIESSCSSLDRIGDAGIKTLFFFLIYVVLCIYSFHIEKLQHGWGLIPKIIDRGITVIVPVFLPLFIFSENNGGCESEFSSVSYSLLFFIVIMVFDIKGSIRKAIVDYYEGKVEKFGSDLFYNYPPKSMLDIYIQLVIIAVIIILISFLS